MHTPHSISASTIIDTDVQNSDGEDLGNIKDIVIDTANGRINYAVLSFGGLMGLGDKYFAIPWEAITYDSDEESYILNVAKEKLENAEGFDKDDWPDMNNLEWHSHVYKYYGYNPYWL